ncbi:hypothetical protein JNW88_26315 [Micromonospora sp. ATA32]|nr:hypothetical protein [Micromonospora sp. ATA32]
MFANRPTGDLRGLAVRVRIGRPRRVPPARYRVARGPAVARLPDHLTQLDQGVRTTQVIAPGVGCPSNAFFARAVAAIGVDHLYITSANRSRHLTGAEGGAGTLLSFHAPGGADGRPRRVRPRVIGSPGVRPSRGCPTTSPSSTRAYGPPR